ncbi:MAG: hypothetical protein SGI84_07585 [Gemmatimonadota bacterium]|nr:hypothetical protein [Gemmatimonadota bacterium]
MKRTLLVGSALTGLLAATLGAGFGRIGVVPGLVFGALATAIQAGAGHAMRGAAELPYSAFLKRYGIGMGLRLGGVGVLMAAIVMEPALFPPLPSAIGFLGVLIPLLFFETRMAR